MENIANILRDEIEKLLARFKWLHFNLSRSIAPHLYIFEGTYICVQLQVQIEFDMDPATLNYDLNLPPTWTFYFENEFKLAAAIDTWAADALIDKIDDFLGSFIEEDAEADEMFIDSD